MTQRSRFIIEEVEIRQAEESDADVLASLVSEHGFGYPTEPSLVRERLGELNRAGDRVLVAIYDSKVVGMALLHCTRFLHRSPDGRISALVVSETDRGRGIGARLVLAAERHRTIPNRTEKSSVGTNRSKESASGRERHCRWTMHGVSWKAT